MIRAYDPEHWWRTNRSPLEQPECSCQIWSAVVARQRPPDEGGFTAAVGPGAIHL